MHSSRRLTLLLFIAAFLVAQPARSQDLGETLEGVGAAYAKAYVQPLVDAFGADINSGLFHSAKIGGGLLPMVDIYLGVKVFGALIPSGDKTLDLTYTMPQVFTGSDGMEYTVDVTYQINDAPTVFGDAENPGVVTAMVHEVVSPGPDGQSGTADDVVIDETTSLELLPGLLETSIAPLVVPQLRLGSAFGTDVMIRYLPSIELGDVGSIGFFGFGVRHSISQYVPLFPLDVAAQVTFQNLGIEDAANDDLLSASMWAMSVMASKSFLVATVYGGLQVESTGLDVSYTYVDPEGLLPDEDISFSMTGSNRFRVVAGAALNLSPISINVDYSVGSMSVVSAGIGISL